MRILIYVLLIIEVLVRYNTSRKRTISQLQTLMVSAMIQSLIIYPLIFSTISIDKGGYEFVGGFYETSVGLLFPTVIVFALTMLHSKKQKWNFQEVKFLFVCIVIAFIYSYFTPLNASHQATTIGLIFFLQIFIVIYICKTYITGNQLVEALYDGLKIALWVEFLISVSYSIFGIYAIQTLFYSDAESEEWIREGTNIRRAYGTFGQPNRLGGFCALIYIFYLSCNLLNYHRRTSLYLAAISMFTILLSQSRSALFASVMSSFFLYVVVLYKKGIRVRKLMIGVIILCIMGLAALQLSIVRDMLFKSDVEEMEEARFMHYIMGWDILRMNHYMGVGMNAHVPYMLYKYPNMFGEFFNTRPIHNLHLGIFVETGLVGFLAWVYFLVSRIRKVLVTPMKKMNAPVLWFTYMGMLLIILIHGFTDLVYLHYQCLLIVMFVGAFYTTKKPMKTRLLDCGKIEQTHLA